MRGPTTVWTHDDVALVLIDFQKEMFEAVRSEVPGSLIELNVKFLIRIAKVFDIPIVLSTVGVDIGVNGPTRQSILDELPDHAPVALSVPVPDSAIWPAAAAASFPVRPPIFSRPPFPWPVCF